MAKGPCYSCSVQSREFLLADCIFKRIIPLIYIFHSVYHRIQSILLNSQCCTRVTVAHNLTMQNQPVYFRICLEYSIL